MTVSGEERTAKLRLLQLHILAPRELWSSPDRTRSFIVSKRVFFNDPLHLEPGPC